MAESLLYTVPSNQLAAVKERIVANAEGSKVKREAPAEAEDREQPSPLSPSLPKKATIFVDLVEEKELAPTSKSEADLACMKTLGITATQDDFFASSVQFINTRSGELEKEKAAYYRQEVWVWMEQSLAKGNYKWIVRTISPVFDIRSLYNKVVSLANRATWISHALEFKKIFQISPASMDIFQYHAELVTQIKLVRTQGEALGLSAEVPKWMEQSLLLIAAWQNPQYQKIAMDFSMDGKVVSVETLVRELQNQSLLTVHLNQSGGKAQRQGSDVRVRAAAASQPKHCFGFQKGKCVRTDCPYLHEIMPVEAKNQDAQQGKPKPKAVAKKQSTKKGTGKKGKASPQHPVATRRGGAGQAKCGKCGGGHPVAECKYDGECSYCHRTGHKQSVCRKKAGDEGRARVAFVSPAEDISIRVACVQNSQPRHMSLQETVDNACVSSGDTCHPEQDEGPILVRMLRVKGEKKNPNFSSNFSSKARPGCIPRGQNVAVPNPLPTPSAPSWYFPSEAPVPLVEIRASEPVPPLVWYRTSAPSFPVALPDFTVYSPGEEEFSEDSSYDEYTSIGNVCVSKPPIAMHMQPAAPGGPPIGPPSAGPSLSLSLFPPLEGKESLHSEWLHRWKLWSYVGAIDRWREN
jgi:hypothetical protein